MSKTNIPSGSPAVPSTDAADTRSLGARARNIQGLALAGFLVLLVVGFSATTPHFLSVVNFTNILLSVSVIGCMAPVATLVLVSRNFDLSVGAIMGIVAVSTGLLLTAGYSAWLAIAAALSIGLVSGALNAGLTAGLGIDSIIVTVGTMAVFRGLAYYISAGQTGIVENETILQLGSGRILGVPYSVLVMLAIFAASGFFATYTRAGRAIYAIGSNARASRLSGISLGWHRLLVFAASGVAAALAALLFLGQAASAIASAGTGYELLVLTAVLLGGASLNGGEGRVGGTLLGVLIIGVLSNGMTLMGVDSYLQMMANGILLLAAVALDQARRHAKIAFLIPSWAR